MAAHAPQPVPHTRPSKSNAMNPDANMNMAMSGQSLADSGWRRQYSRVGFFGFPFFICDLLLIFRDIPDLGAYCSFGANFHLGKFRPVRCVIGRRPSVRLRGLLVLVCSVGEGVRAVFSLRGWRMWRGMFSFLGFGTWKFGGLLMVWLSDEYVQSLKERIVRVGALLKTAGILQEGDLSHDDFSDEDSDDEPPSQDISSASSPTPSSLCRKGAGLEVTSIFRADERDDSRYFGETLTVADLKLSSTNKSHRQVLLIVYLVSDRHRVDQKQNRRCQFLANSFARIHTR